MSAFRGEADGDQRPSECPLLAKSGPKATRVRSPRTSENGVGVNPSGAHYLFMG